MALYSEDTNNITINATWSINNI